MALPFTAAWQYDTLRRAVAEQAAPPAPSSGDGGPGPGADVEPAPAGNAPVVLAYHDVGPDDRSRYTVSPEHFDAQLRALRDAGYRTLTTREFTGFLRTGRTPGPRTVHLTFDDGTHGLWTHADPVLARYGMKAAAYLITGQVGTHRPYYLSWPEVERMARSGRWDFQAHTRLSHERAAVDAAGHERSVFTNRLWLADEGRVETSDEYRRRVAADLDRSIRDLVRHDLPRPRLFAYPFSERLDESNLGARDADALRSMLRERFTATLTNSAARPLPAGPRAAAAGQVQRLEVTRDTTAAGLLRELGRWATVTPQDADRPLAHPAHWQTTGATGQAGPGMLTGGSPPPGRHGVRLGRLPPVRHRRLDRLPPAHRRRRPARHLQQCGNHPAGGQRTSRVALRRPPHGEPHHGGPGDNRRPAELPAEALRHPPDHRLRDPAARAGERRRRDLRGGPRGPVAGRGGRRGLLAQRAQRRAGAAVAPLHLAEGRVTRITCGRRSLPAPAAVRRAQHHS
ncbi:polysaccharide deacetylase family protein [Streptomyces lividans]|uniref:Polysaccharide deacetylase n=1 Tax=Streptomyces lividans 1326 TaxID=1200984 RepID=A0A7U9HCT1_STRLI|nr:polysaccharide deacetylase family protein [Streptomyces lividans]EOY50038.1 polysaccharide deacetylase [Streptomyces lividans 1326]